MMLNSRYLFTALATGARCANVCHLIPGSKNFFCLFTLNLCTVGQSQDGIVKNVGNIHFIFLFAFQLIVMQTVSAAFPITVNRCKVCSVLLALCIEKSAVLGVLGAIGTVIYKTLGQYL